jgi:hypothetical protein
MRIFALNMYAVNMRFDLSPYVSGVSHVEPTSEQYSFQHIRLFGLHNHLYGDPWQNNDVYYFNDKGILISNTWDQLVSLHCFEQILFLLNLL